MSHPVEETPPVTVALTDGPRSVAVSPLHVPASNRSGYTALNNTMSHVGKRKYEIFPGRNTFHCGGRVIMGKDKGFFFFTVGLFLFGGALFFAFDCVYLATRVHWSIPIVGAVLYIFSLSNLLRAGLMDPGIIPRATADEAAYTEKSFEAPKQENMYRPPPRLKEVTVNGVNITLKYCNTCGMFRPPRASHCSICDNCVDNFDHHCPWVGNCVGKRNYRHFYLFLVCTCILSLFVLGCNIATLVLATKEEEGKTFLETLSDWRRPASLIEGIICFITIWSVTGLAGFHTYLIASSVTTNEDIKGTWSRKRNPENKNPFSHNSFRKNFCAALCGPNSSSLLDSRGIVTEDYSVVKHSPLKPAEPYIPKPPGQVEGYQNETTVAVTANNDAPQPANGQS